MADEYGHKSAYTWEVVVATLYERGDPSQGAEETTVVEGSEEEARRVFKDAVSTAAEQGYAYVKLRREGADAESWPQETGWTV